MAVVETRDLRKVFGEAPAVDGIDLRTKEGEYLVLLGPSGCGKTTLLRMIAGLERPTSGEVLIGGEVVNDLPPRARRIAMVFQSYALYPHKTVRANIAFPLAARGVEKGEREQKIRWAAALLDIEQLLPKRPRQLSGGERQRVALARALVREPQVFLLDEPLSNLDAKLRALAREELKEFQRRVGTTTVYVTHDQVEAMGLGDRIAVLNKGRVQQVGTPWEIYHYPASTFVATFVGSPPMNLIEREAALVGFRPEHFLPEDLVGERGGRVLLDFRVERVEYLGSDRFVYGSVRGTSTEHRVIARLPFTVTDEVVERASNRFAVASTNLHTYSKESGERIDAKSPVDVGATTRLREPGS
jgi:multiple sugar transport system ATP-binding protein